MPAAYVLILAAVAFGIGYAASAGLRSLPEDVLDVAEAFGAVEQVGACHALGIGQESELAFPDSGNALAVAIVKAAEARGMRRGMLLGFIAGAK